MLTICPPFHSALCGPPYLCKAAGWLVREIEEGSLGWALLEQQEMWLQQVGEMVAQKICWNNSLKETTKRGWEMLLHVESIMAKLWGKGALII